MSKPRCVLWDLEFEESAKLLGYTFTRDAKKRSGYDEGWREKRLWDEASREVKAERDRLRRELDGLGNETEECKQLKADVGWFKKLADDRLRQRWADVNVRAAEVAALKAENERLKKIHANTVFDSDQYREVVAELDNLKAENADLISSNKAYQLSSGLALQDRDKLKAENAALREALREAFREGFYDGSFGSYSRKLEEEDWNDSRTKRLLSEFIINKEDGE